MTAINGIAKINVAIPAAGDIASANAHNPAYHSDYFIDRSVADLALQQRLGLLSGRRFARLDCFNPVALASIERLADFADQLKLPA